MRLRRIELGVGWVLGSNGRNRGREILGFQGSSILPLVGKRRIVPLVGSRRIVPLGSMRVAPLVGRRMLLVWWICYLV